MIERAAFGKTGHESTRMMFGAAALGGMRQEKADRVLETLFEFGVNHLDTAASYGDSELRIGPWMQRYRERFFLEFAKLHGVVLATLAQPLPDADVLAKGRCQVPCFQCATGILRTMGLTAGAVGTCSAVGVTAGASAGGCVLLILSAHVSVVEAGATCAGCNLCHGSHGKPADRDSDDRDCSCTCAGEPMCDCETECDGGGG